MSAMNRLKILELAAYGALARYQDCKAGGRLNTEQLWAEYQEVEKMYAEAKLEAAKRSKACLPL